MPGGTFPEKERAMTETGRFVWYDLMTTELPAARDFYAHVMGWSIAHAGMPGTDYNLARLGAVPVGGMMTLPDAARAQGGRAGWMGYVAVADVDAASVDLRAAGGTIHRAPEDIPGIGRFCVAADPQGAVFVLFRGAGPLPPALCRRPLRPARPGISAGTNCTPATGRRPSPSTRPSSAG